MASSSSSHNYEVFLSFRGVDTRRNFTDHLYRALDRVGVRTFRDNEELKQGEEIGPELLKAIKESKISIPIFSENYASSKWCLKELAKIMDCMETDDQVVWPIFYKVEPSDVRNQSGSFAQAFLEHENKQSKETLDKWREALSKAGSLSGWDSEDPKNSYEAEMIASIVEKALNELNKNNTLEVAEHPIGMDARVEEVLRLIDVESKDVQFVGILGIGWIGKTTIAKAVFNKISRHFQGRCFLRDVRDTALRKGLDDLQKKLVCDVLNIDKIHISSVDEGINVIKDRIRSKKVLVILDDVDQDEHLNKLAGGRNWFGPNSTIIITTRDKHILDRVDECKIYMPDVLDDNQSLQLFSNHAFRRHQPPEDFRELSEKFLGIIRGLPLALKVVGSFLQGKEDHQEWESVLERLNKIPNDKIQNCLKISYDGLEKEDKEIFLDIACFFIGMDEEIVLHILEDHFPKTRINVLVLKSLVTIDRNNKLGMHDLIRDMGREIVRDKSPKILGKRSRLWSHEEALYVLKKCKGTQNVEGLLLNFGSEAEDCSLKVEAFKEMSELRLLQIDHAYLEGDFDHFPGELKWLSWKGLPSKCTISHQEKLSVLDLSGGMIIDDWSGWQHIQSIKTLKVLDLRGCLNLTRTPDFSHLTSLKRLILDGCEGLVVCHESIGQLKNLDFLSLKACGLVELPEDFGRLSSLKSLSLSQSKLRSLPASFSCLSGLQTLDLRSCEELRSIPELPSSLIKLNASRCSSMERLPELSNLKFLQELNLWGCGKLSEIQGISGFSCLSGLHTLNLSWCTELRSIPELPSSLIKLDASGCSSMERLPELSNLKFSQELDLSECGKLSEIQGISGFSCLSGLQTLDLSGCTELRSIPELPSSLIKLDACGCTSMERLPELSNLKFLQELILSNCEKLSEIQGISGFSCLSGLHTLYLSGCKELRSIPELPSSLIKLVARGCSSMERLPELSNLKFLQELNLSCCGKLFENQGISGFSCLSGLHTLDLSWCTELRSIPELPSSLIKLYAMGCSSMERLPELSNLKFLQVLDLSDCWNLSEIQGISGFSCLSGLHILDLSRCTKLRSIPELPSSLIKLNACGCTSMEILPELSNLKFLRELNLSDCRKLSEIQGISGLPLLQTLDLSGCTTLQSLSELPSSLVSLHIGKCISIEILSNLSNLRSIECIDLVNCKNLVENQGMKGLVLLEILCLVGCETLQSLPELPLGNLSVLVIMNCRNLSKIQGISCLPRLQILTLKNCEKLQSLPMLPSSLINLKAKGCISLERLPDMSNLKNLEILQLKFCHNLAEIRGLEGLESLISLILYECHTCVQNFLKIVAQGILPSDSYECEWMLSKEYLIPDVDNIKGMVFFMVYKLPIKVRYDTSDSYGFLGDFSDDITVKIWAKVTRNDGKRISCGINIRLEGWENTDIGDQLYSCYFQGLTWFGIPLQKGDILRLSAVPSDYQVEFAVAYEAIEDDQQLEKGVKHLITSILECEPRDYKCAHSPYRMPSVSGGRREC